MGSHWWGGEGGGGGEGFRKRNVMISYVLRRLLADEKEMATHSSILAWRIPWTVELGRLQVHRVTKSWTE